MIDTKTLMEFVVKIAEEAGEIMRHYFALSDKGVTIKTDQTPVSAADKKINNLLIEHVKRTFPTHGVLGEEESYNQASSELWVCDPIDGTVAYILGAPTAMFSLAFVLNGEPQVAVAYEPQLKKMFTAVKGKGAYLNSQPIRVSQRTSLHQANIGLIASVGQMFEREAFYRALIADGAYLNNVPGNVFKGSLVACGRLDGCIFPGTGAHDVAAEKLIIEEAGGKVTSLEGKGQRYDGKIRGAIMSNGHVHDALVRHLQQFGVEKYLGHQK